MKIVTEEELQELDKATRRGAAEGILAGLALALPASFYLQRRSQWYRGLPIQLKALGVILVVGPAYAIQTERRAVQFDEERYWYVYIPSCPPFSHWATDLTTVWHRTYFCRGKDYGSETIRSAQSEAELRWKTLSRSEKLKEWTIKNQYSILAGGWALGMAVASGIIWRDRYVSVITCSISILILLSSC